EAAGCGACWPDSPSCADPTPCRPPRLSAGAPAAPAVAAAPPLLPQAAMTIDTRSRTSTIGSARSTRRMVRMQCPPRLAPAGGRRGVSLTLRFGPRFRGATRRAGEPSGQPTPGPNQPGSRLTSRCSMDRSAARRVLALALLLGVTAEILFDGPAFGINVSIGIVTLLAAGWLVRRRGTAPDPLDAWLPVAAVVCAVLVAVSGDRFLALMATV